MNTRGEYFYARHHNMWGIWRRDNVQGGGVESGTFIADKTTKEEAAREVYRLNGWKYKSKSD